MSTSGAVNAGLSGLNSAAIKLRNAGGNIAGAYSQGFKEFQSLDASLVSSEKSSYSGVITLSRLNMHKRGDYDRTEVTTDIVVDGDGFITVSQALDNSTNPTTEIAFAKTRSFRSDKNGNLVDIQGNKLLAWKLDPDGDLPAANSTTSSLSVVNIDELISEAASTTDVDFGFVLDARSDVAGGGTTVFQLQSDLNRTSAVDEPIAPNPTRNMSIGEGIRIKIESSSSTTSDRTIDIVYGGFVESKTLTKTGSTITPGAQISMTTNSKTHIFTTTGNNDGEIMENLYADINATVGAAALKARLVDDGVSYTLLVSPKDANKDLSFTGDVTARQAIGFADTDSIAAASAGVNRFSSVTNLADILSKEGVTTDIEGNILAIKSLNPLFIENYTPLGNDGQFIEEFGLTEGYIKTAYDPLDQTNNMAGGAFKDSFSKDFTINDALGNEHNMIVRFLKLDTNYWAMELHALDPTVVDIGGRVDGLIQAGFLRFDGSGNLVEITDATPTAKTDIFSSASALLQASQAQTFTMSVGGNTAVSFNYDANTSVRSTIDITGTNTDFHSSDILEFTVGTGAAAVTSQVYMHTPVYRSTAVIDGTAVTITTGQGVPATDAGDTFDIIVGANPAVTISRGSGTTNLAVLQNVRDQINANVPGATANIMYDPDVNNLRLNVVADTPTDALVINNPVEVNGGATTLIAGLNVAATTEMNNQEQMANLVNQLNQLTGSTGVRAQVVSGTLAGSIRLDITTLDPTLEMTVDYATSGNTAGAATMLGFVSSVGSASIADVGAAGTLAGGAGNITFDITDSSGNTTSYNVPVLAADDVPTVVAAIQAALPATATVVVDNDAGTAGFIRVIPNVANGETITVTNDPTVYGFAQVASSSRNHILENRFNSLYSLAEAVETVTGDGTGGVSTEVLYDSTSGGYSMRFNPQIAGEGIIFGGTTATMSPPLGDGTAGQIYVALGLENNTGNPVAGLSENLDIEWSSIVGADPSSITINWQNAVAEGLIRQDARNSAVNKLEQNGIAPGRLSDITIDKGGIITAVFSNGQTRDIFKIAIADFANPNGLIPQDGNLFNIGRDSGPLNLKEAGSEGTGAILSGTLENSNVDIAEQLAITFQAQQQYQACAKIISTADKMQETLINRAFGG
jgi:flagellar hook protein FlgE